MPSLYSARAKVYAWIFFGYFVAKKAKNGN